MRGHHGIVEILGLARLLGIKSERTAIEIRLIVPHRPAVVLPLAAAPEVAVAIDVITDGVTVLVEGPEILGAGGCPVGAGHHALETAVAQELIRLPLKPALAPRERRGGVFVANGCLPG